MNVTLNTNKFQSYNNQNNTQNKFKQNVSFTAKPSSIGDEVSKAASGSKLFEPFTKAYDSSTDWLAKNVFSGVVNNQYVQKFANKFKNNDMLFNHFLAMGSLITSGLYVKKTLDSKDLDKDRKNTLAINQVLTFGISTVGAYSMDKVVNKWWNNVTAKYIGNQLGDSEYLAKYQKAVTKAKDANKLLKEANKTLAKANKKPLEIVPRVGDLIKESKFYNKELHNTLSTKVSGMGKLKTMIVFGMVYRFIVPVLVTPIANKLGDKMVQKRKAKEALEKQNQEIKKS